LGKAKANLDVKEEELGVAVTEKQEEERKAAAMARAVALEAESKILSGWLKEVYGITGVGPRRALGRSFRRMASCVATRWRVTERAAMEKVGILTSFLQPQQQCRGMLRQRSVRPSARTNWMRKVM
jgi:hypothetical protein